MSNAQNIDFVSCISNHQHVFGVNAAYVNIHSIERYYANYFNTGVNSSSAVFANWRNGERQTGYMNLIAAFDSLFANRDIDMNYLAAMNPDVYNDLFSLENVSTEQKVAYLIRKHGTTQSVVIHPLIVIVFAFDISPSFKMFIVSRLPGIMNIDDAPRQCVELAKQYDSLVHLHNSMVRDFQVVIHERESQIQQAQFDLTNSHRQLQQAVAEKNNAEQRIAIMQRNAFCVKVSKCWSSVFRRKRMSDGYQFIQDL